ncbi:MAG: DUF1987 domain-containing protein [Helicobacteraceae bacterium]|nr:DUF1987 domain-containing protein [Helicobacteraceae bacterium]
MKNLEITATKNSPQINFSASTGILSITGESYLEDVTPFYEPVLNWLNEYLEDLDEEDVAIFNMDVANFNSSSSEAFVNIFDMLEDCAQADIDVTINWFFDEDDELSQERGEEFAEDLEDVTFVFVKKTK